ncbi:MAG: hypothetical protein LC104_09995 [Bacteroidales bacterium]|nr:hypothetical protein [Bacteroidales bacterium]
MTTPPTSAPKPPLAADLVQEVKLSDAAQQWLQPHLTIEQYFDVLNREQLYSDGIRFLTQLLPPKRAIWWGCLCVWAAADARTCVAVEPVLASVLLWLREPQDTHRRAVAAVAQTVGNMTAAGMLGKAVFLSEGSISFPGQPEVRADGKVALQLVASSILMAARSAGATAASGSMRQFLAIGVDVYQGKNSWERPKPFREG